MSNNMQQPYTQFTQWFEEAKNHPHIDEPTAMALATCFDNMPSCRIVLLKAHDDRGFVFYTNFESRKGCELAANPHAALTFYWMPMKRQIRIEGGVEKVSDTEADAYFLSRPRESRIGAWASAQSRPLAHREEFTDAIAEYTARFEGKDVPRPPHWSGFRVIPHRIEFWQEVEFRLHDREVYTIISKEWVKTLIYP